MTEIPSGTFSTNVDENSADLLMSCLSIFITQAMEHMSDAQREQLRGDIAGGKLRLEIEVPPLSIRIQTADPDGNLRDVAEITDSRSVWNRWASDLVARIN